jgi:hypothetical protein
VSITLQLYRKGEKLPSSELKVENLQKEKAVVVGWDLSPEGLLVGT